MAAWAGRAYPGEVTLRPLALLVLAGLAACGDPSDEPPADDDGGAPPSEPVPAPAFLNPAVGSFLIEATQLEPERMLVQHVEPGATQVLIDGLALARLGPDSPFGELSADSLTLRLRGALAAGEHSLQLMTPGKPGPRYSVRLTMQVAAPDPETRPTFSAALEPTVHATGTALLASGVGPGGLLGVLGSGASAPELRLFRADDDGWSTAEPLVVALEGHVLKAMSPGPAVAAIAVAEADGGPPRRLRVAHTVALPARAVVTRDILLEPEPTVLAPITALDLDAALAGAPAEWAAFGRPALLGPSLLVELNAPADAEQPHPGDHRLIASFWRGDQLRWGPPQRVGTATPTDLDSLGPAPVLWDIPNATGAALSLRLGGAFPGVLTVSDTGAISITTPPQTAALDVRGEIALATILSDFGSRTVAAVDPQGRFSLSLLDTSRGNAPRRISPKSAELAGLPVTGPLAAGVGRGFPFFLVPHGDAAPVTVVVSNGERSFVQTLDELHCDALALAVTLAGNDPERAAIPLACLLHGELRLGEVLVPPAD